MNHSPCSLCVTLSAKFDALGSTYAEAVSAYWHATRTNTGDASILLTRVDRARTSYKSAQLELRKHRRTHAPGSRFTSGKPTEWNTAAVFQTRSILAPRQNDKLSVVDPAKDNGNPRQAA